MANKVTIKILYNTMFEGPIYRPIAGSGDVVTVSEPETNKILPKKENPLGKELFG